MLACLDVGIPWYPGRYPYVKKHIILDDYYLLGIWVYRRYILGIDIASEKSSSFNKV